jgi:hypothetical protein
MSAYQSMSAGATAFLESSHFRPFRTMTKGAHGSVIRLRSEIGMAPLAIIVGQHLTGADRAQLMDITDDEQGRLGRGRLEKRVLRVV